MLNPIDRSLAFTALLEFEWFRRAESRDGEKYVTALLEDFAASAERNLWTFAQTWGREVSGA